MLLMRRAATAWDAREPVVREAGASRVEMKMIRSIEVNDNENMNFQGPRIRLEDGTVLSSRATAKRFVDAASRMLLGHRATGSEPRPVDQLLVAIGPELGPDGMLWLAGMAQDNQQSVVYLSIRPEALNVPAIAFAAHLGKQVRVHKHCLLTLRHGDRRARLLPIELSQGAYVFGADGRPSIVAAPRSHAAARDDMTRAYVRFGEHIKTPPKDGWSPEILATAC
jgi:hypothetical protein